jgi:hypothetical protein
MAGQKVPFASENARECICMQCPVQSKSLCAKEKEKSSKGSTQPKPQDTPRLYCSSGKAICKDIDTKQMCICGVCSVWNKFKLAGAKPPMYFCRDGTAR